MTLALVTGASGMLGQAVTARLLAAGLTVRAFVRPSSRLPAWPARPGQLQLAYGDAANLAADPAAIQQAMRGVELVFHLAGYLSANAPLQRAGRAPLPAPYQSINVDFTTALLDAAASAGVVRFLYASSSSVYALDAPVPTTEAAPTRPGSHYGRSKLLAEAQVRAFQAQGLPGTIIRPAIIYGPGDRHFLPTVQRLARLPLLPLIDGGRTLLDLIYVDDVAELLWLAAQSAAAVNQVYNGGPGAPTSLRDFVLALRRATGRGPRIITVPAGWVRPGAALLPPLALALQDLHLDMRRAAAELGFTPRIGLAEGLRRCVNRSP